MRRASGRFPISLFDEIDNSGLVLYRILFGFLMAWECAGLVVIGWVRRNLVEPSVVFPMIGFEWLPRLPGRTPYLYFAVMALLGALVMAGAFFRVNLALFTLLWTGAYVMQTASYNNHYYLLILLCLLLLATPAHAYLSYDARRRPAVARPTCPRWCVLIFVVQTAIVYFFAFVAKLDADWLAAKPLAIWLAERTGYPIIGPLYARPWLAWLMAYGGLLYDGLVVPMLLWPRTRLLAVAASVVFHVFNSITFQIGIFPYLAIGLCLFFFPADALRRRFFPRKPAVAQGRVTTPPARRRLVLAAAAIYFALQVALPLRHLAYPGNVNWTEEGHRMSWRMMLRTKWGRIHYLVRHPASGASWTVNPADELSEKQAGRIATRPDMIWQYAQRLKRRYAENAIGEVQIYAFSEVSLNGRKPQPIVDGTVDLARVEWSFFTPASWITALEE
jgi:hypothetical protein